MCACVRMCVRAHTHVQVCNTDLEVFDGDRVLVDAEYTCTWWQRHVLRHVHGHVCTDMCVDMCVDICMDMRIDKCIDMCI